MALGNWLMIPRRFVRTSGVNPAPSATRKDQQEESIRLIDLLKFPHSTEKGAKEGKEKAILSGNRGSHTWQHRFVSKQEQQTSFDCSCLVFTISTQRGKGQLTVL